MNKRTDIEGILTAEKIAVAGVSRNRNKFGNIVYRNLISKGYNVVAINPNRDEIDGRPCYKSVLSLPDDVDALIFVTKPEITTKLVKEAEEKGIKKIWFQQGAESPEALKYCEDNNLSAVSGACIMMYAEPVKSLHKFHQGVSRLFGNYIK